MCSTSSNSVSYHIHLHIDRNYHSIHRGFMPFRSRKKLWDPPGNLKWRLFFLSNWIILQIFLVIKNARWISSNIDIYNSVGHLRLKKLYFTSQLSLGCVKASHWAQSGHLKPLWTFRVWTVYSSVLLSLFNRTCFPTCLCFHCSMLASHLGHAYRAQTHDIAGKEDWWLRFWFGSFFFFNLIYSEDIKIVLNLSF